MTMHEILDLFSEAHPAGRFHSLCIFPNGTATAVFPLTVQKFESLKELEICAEILKERLCGEGKSDLPPPDPDPKPSLSNVFVGDGFKRGRNLTR